MDIYRCREGVFFAVFAEYPIQMIFTSTVLTFDALVVDKC
jgi:hypothetical protein